MLPSESEAVRAMFNIVILEGISYPHLKPLAPEELARYWLQGDAFVVRLCQETEAVSIPASHIWGAFYIKPNFPGRCNHICNAGFIVAPEARGQGVGRLMGEAMLSLARDSDSMAVMYNLIFATNIAALKIWKSLGFRQMGQIPEAAHLPDSCYVDAIMLYKSLVDEA